MRCVAICLKDRCRCALQIGEDRAEWFDVIPQPSFSHPLASTERFAL
jgi:hypothetical protein